MYDDPNKVQEEENITIDFYNGMTRGSFKRGLKTGFVLACNFSLGKIQRQVRYTHSLLICYALNFRGQTAMHPLGHNCVLSEMSEILAPKMCN